MKIKYVNVYLLDRAYGGPEEGGWYYTYGTKIKSIPTLKPRKLYKKVLRWCEQQNEGTPEIYSVLSQGRYDVYIEDGPAQSWPESKPYYE